METIDKDDKEHLQLINKAIRENNYENLFHLMENKSYSEDYLKKSFLLACGNGKLEIIQFLMLSKTFTPNQLSVRGVEAAFRNKHSTVINWLIFDYKMNKSCAIEEVLIEMSDKDYVKHIESLFEKREMNKSLTEKFQTKNVNYKNKI